MKWEYTRLAYNDEHAKEEDIIAHLDAFGLIGWELVSVHKLHSDCCIATFKRPLP